MKNFFRGDISNKFILPSETVIDLSYNWNWHLLRQTPNSTGEWGATRFYENRNFSRCDYWVVCEDISAKQSKLCSPENTILLICEPEGIKTYSQNFLDQFGLVISCRKDLSHRNIIYGQTALHWHIGWNFKRSTFEKYPYSLNYDLLKSQKPIQKTKILSIISSDKRSKKGHQQRFDFVEYLKQHLDHDVVDFYGRGTNSVNDKWDALEQYKYHLVIENTSDEHYWTEKLSDAFLAECYPIYYGCKNIYDYFDENMLTTINIADYEDSLTTILDILDSNKFENSYADILKAKHKCLDEYNLFPMIIDVINKFSNYTRKKIPSVTTLHPQNSFK